LMIVSVYISERKGFRPARSGCHCGLFDVADVKVVC
jgi:hypothetical protein